jgi:hypothetical protein
MFAFIAAAAAVVAVAVLIAYHSIRGSVKSTSPYVEGVYDHDERGLRSYSVRSNSKV